MSEISADTKLIVSESMNRRYIRVLREIVMADISQYTSYKEMAEDIQSMASHTVGEFTVEDYNV